MEHQVKIVIGANYGDEGKGLMSRCFTNEFLKAGKKPVTVFYNGSAQRGHTADYEDGTRHVFHNFCAGAKEGGATFYANTFRVHPMDFCRELDELNYIPTVYCDPGCVIVTPLDMLADQIIVDFNAAKTGKREYGSCCYGTWSLADRINAEPMTVGEYKDSLYWNWVNEMVDWFDERLKSFGVEPDAVPQWKDYIEHRNALIGIAYHFKADMEQFMDTIRPSYNIEIMLKFDGIIFEGAQGLGLDLDRHFSEKWPTTSSTGLKNPKRFLERCSVPFDAEVCYVTRTYLTRHGDGPLPGECEKSTLRYLVDDVVDKTNVWNPFQGGLRYAPLDVDALRKRIETDFGSDWMQEKGQYTPTIALTHCNEVEIPVFGETYRSYKPHEAFKPATGGLIESYKVRELVLGHD